MHANYAAGVEAQECIYAMILSHTDYDPVTFEWPFGLVRLFIRIVRTDSHRSTR